MEKVKITRALLSCYDKSGLDVFAKTLSDLGIELVASGGTADYLKEHGLRVKGLDSFAGISKQLDGRVKTLHPKIHAGILALRDHPAHMSMIGEDGRIDMVVGNLYPFEKTIQDPGVSLENALNEIDIGGVALLRAAAKNFHYVVSVSHPQQYATLIRALNSSKGSVPVSTSRELAIAAFKLTSQYDMLIAKFFASRSNRNKADNAITVASVKQKQSLRYGENPHSNADWFVPAGEPTWGLANLSQLQGKDLSYNNFLDLDAVLRCLTGLKNPSVVIVKHRTPCGLASSDSVTAAYEGAYNCDSESAFGGVVGLNEAVDVKLAEKLTNTFFEVVLAPSVTGKAKSILAKKKNLRVVTLPLLASAPLDSEWRQLWGGWLRQETSRSDNKKNWKVATKKSPNSKQKADLDFAWHAAKHVISNGVVVVKDNATVGIGQGQPSRVRSARFAIEQAGKKAKGAVVASDGFFPFADSVTLLAEAGISAIIQPGGSMRDKEVIAEANKKGVAMLLTGMRYFKH